LAARDIEVELVSFGKSLPQMLDARSTSEVAKPRILEKSDGPLKARTAADSPSFAVLRGAKAA